MLTSHPAAVSVPPQRGPAAGRLNLARFSRATAAQIAAEQATSPAGLPKRAARLAESNPSSVTNSETTPAGWASAGCGLSRSR